MSEQPQRVKRKPQSPEEMDRFLSEEERKRMPFTRKDFEDALKKSSRRLVYFPRRVSKEAFPQCYREAIGMDMVR